MYVSEPIGATEMGQHIENLELVKDDFSKVLDIDNASIKTTKKGTIATFKGKELSLIASFDNQGNYINCEIKDERFISSYITCLGVLTISSLSAYGIAFYIHIVFKLPIYIHNIYSKCKNKKIKKEKQYEKTT